MSHPVDSSFSHRCPGDERACYNIHDIRYTGDYTYISEAAVNSSWAKLACTDALVCTHVDSLTVSTLTDMSKIQRLGCVNSLSYYTCLLM